MADRVSQYTIELDIAQGDKTRATVDGIERAVRGISDAARGNDLAKGLATASNAARDLETQMRGIVESGEDATDAMAAYDKAANRAMADLEKQATAINHALSAQGKAQRERISEIERELAATQKTRENAEKRKALEAELKALKKGVVQGSDDELKAALRNNQAIRARLRMIQEQGKAQRAAAKLQTQEIKAQRTLSGLLKDDLAILKERLREQFKFISALKTTEGRYAAIKKAAGAIGGGVGKLAKGAAIGVGGTMMALGGAAMAGASAEVEREREAARIKAPGLSDAEKRDLLGEIYINTGADYTSIVDAINRVYGVIGSAGRADLVQATTAELRYPGAAAMFRQQNTGAATAANFSDYAGRMRALQGATGATVEQISAAASKISNLAQGSFRGGATQADLAALYLALQGSGAYDEQGELDAAFAKFVETQAKTGQDLFEMAKTWDWGRGLSATNRQQATAALANVDWARVSGAAREKGELATTDAENMARKMRELEEKKNKILAKMLEAIAPVIDAIDINELSRFFESMVKITNAIAPVISKIVTFATDTIGVLADAITTLADWISEKFGGADATKAAEAYNAVFRAENMPQMASGGVASMPSLVGERGPEAVIPLDFSRSGRAGNIIQNISQTFAMSGNETTTLSLANAVKSRGFGRAMGDAAWINGRLGR